MQATVVKIAVKEGDTVVAGDLLIIVEAMKMEQQIRAPSDGTISSIISREGDTVSQGETLLSMKLSDTS